jgi:hypothetical protein
MCGWISRGNNIRCISIRDSELNRFEFSQPKQGWNMVITDFFNSLRILRNGHNNDSSQKAEPNVRENILLTDCMS